MAPSTVTQPFPGGHIGDARLFLLALGCLLIALVWLGVAASLHRRNLRAVPIRIHVAGARGKSTVTRMIAAGLRSPGLRVIAKATGSEPRLILPDGSEEAWPRRGPASVREQMRFMARAAREGARAVVVECMAVRPEFIWASEAHLVRATLSVITNARPDHFEELGAAPQAMEQALAFVIPAGGRLILSSEAATPHMLALAKERGCAVTIAPTNGCDPPETNRRLALAACEALGVDPKAAAQGIDDAGEDPGQFFMQNMTLEGASFQFINAFACNDVASLEALWTGRRSQAPATVLLNARRDRPLRTQHFLEFLATRNPRPRLYVTGDPLAIRLARRAGFPTRDVSALKARDAKATFRELAADAGPDGEVWGVGNYQGAGRELIACARQTAQPC